VAALLECRHVVELLGLGLQLLLLLQLLVFGLQPVEDLLLVQLLLVLFVLVRVLGEQGLKGYHERRR